MRSINTAGTSNRNREQADMLSRGNLSSTGANFGMDMYGNPCYTVKDGGTLKKKMQPYAADKTSRDGLNIGKERINQVTAPGSYNIKSENKFGKVKHGVGQQPFEKTAAEKLK